MKIPSFKLLAVWLLLVSNSSWADGSKVCVLNFERPEHPLSSMVEEVFGGNPSVEIHQMAMPSDFLNCIRNGSTEILLLGHALLTPNNPEGDKPVNLGYFRNLTGCERREAISSSIAVLSAQIQDLDRNVWLQIDEQQSDDAVKDRELKTERYELEHYSDRDPYYVVRTILPKTMDVARAELAKQARNGGVALKSIRLMSCLPDQVLAQYDDLRALIDENRITLDIAPKNEFMSFMEGMTVTSPNEKWLRESVLP